MDKKIGEVFKEKDKYYKVVAIDETTKHPDRSQPSWKVLVREFDVCEQKTIGRTIIWERKT